MWPNPHAAEFKPEIWPKKDKAHAQVTAKLKEEESIWLVEDLLIRFESHITAGVKHCGGFTTLDKEFISWQKFFRAMITAQKACVHLIYVQIKYELCSMKKKKAATGFKSQQLNTLYTLNIDLLIEKS